MASSVATSSSTSTAGASSSLSLGANWTTYHADNARTGYLPVSNFTSVTRGWTSSVDGAVYAEPLVYGGDVFVATENNSVYALDAQTGSVLWRTNFGPPVDGSKLPCGNINPTGITSTPVIDPSTGMLYAVSYSAMHHDLWAIKTSTGAAVFSRSAEPPSGFNEIAQQVRSALTLANGMVYVLYGGLAGDCAQYTGWVVGLPVDGSGNGPRVYYQVPTAREGGLWAPSGASVDSAGNIYVTTGNAASSTNFDYGNSVIKLSPTLSVLGYFAPTNWAQLSGSDTDLGSLGPAFVGPTQIFQIGKEGVGFLLDPGHLGGIGGQTFSMRVCNESFGGTAYSAPFVFVPCIDGLYVLKIANGTFSTAVHVSGFNSASPIVTGGVVWTVDTNTATLYGLSVATGHQAYAFKLGGVEHFTTPAAGDGRVFVGATNQIVCFVLGQ